VPYVGQHGTYWKNRVLIPSLSKRQIDFLQHFASLIVYLFCLPPEARPGKDWVPMLPSSSNGNGTTRFGVFELDLRAGELRKAGSRIRLQIQPLKVLVALLDEPGAVVTREELKRKIWPEESFGDFDHAVNVAVAKLRAALADSADTPRYIETLPRRGYRFIFPVASAAGHAATPAPASRVQQPGESKRFPWRAAGVGAGMITLVIGAVWWWLHARPQNRLSDKDTIVVADFTNTTGDKVFDGTLRQGLAVQLDQSPFLSLVSEQRIQQTLQLMGQSRDAQITNDVARQLCERTGSAAVIQGSIASLGSQYVLGLKAVNCHTGDVLDEEQVTADAKEHVLKALAGASVMLREKLGESMGMVKKYNTPVEQVTTPSLEALQAYSLGRTTMVDKEDHAGAVLLFQRAIELDPNFAMAYASLGMAYFSRSEKQSLSYFRMAYDLRDRVSERERFYIESHYHESVTGDWEMARQAYELWAQTYPRDDVAHFNLSGIYLHLGQYEKAGVEAEESLKLLPSDCLSAGNIIASLAYRNRLPEAEALIKQQQAMHNTCASLRVAQYALAFLKNDKAGMEHVVSQAAGDEAAQLLRMDAQTAAYYGQVRRAREGFHRAISLAEQSRQQELRAYLQAQQAEMEALLGNPGQARRQAAEALSLSRGSDAVGMTSIALALAGDSARAQSLVDDLSRRFPDNTAVQFNFLPVARAQIALNQGDTSRAIQALHAGALYELGDMAQCNAGFVIYLRGIAYLRAGQEKEAAGEFQKIIDHRTIVLNGPIASLAYLGLARSYAEQGDLANAKSAYSNFLGLWKDADTDAPAYQQARNQLAKLP
jgi:DNA-binding winged helix-turn-helix (wHTH) protein/tetratricopeptide (TPR) repeat protein